MEQQEAEASMRKNRGARCRKPVIARGHFIARSSGRFTRTVGATKASRSTHANVAHAFSNKRENRAALVYAGEKAHGVIAISAFAERTRDAREKLNDQKSVEGAASDTKKQETKLINKTTNVLVRSSLYD